MDSAAKRLKKWAQTNVIPTLDNKVLGEGLREGCNAQDSGCAEGVLKSSEDRTEVTTKQAHERIPPNGEYITFARAAAVLGVSKSTVSKWAKKGKLHDNGQKGQKRRLLMTSVLLVKQGREDEDLAADVLDLRADARRF